ncbi:MAG: methionyl-tRNA formyltransferase [Bacteroidota bacterium]|nr:methionyl-tRNA formyltransferase [Bacteroidota bacterium]
MNIVFYGTPQFAVPSLKAIVKAGFKVKAVVTMPDKLAGRGMKPTPSAVKLAATELGIPVLQPEKMKSPEFMQQLKNINPDIQIVIAFRMMPEMVWNFPPKGTFNLHASMLPQYRGAAPINRAIMNGEISTGLSTFFLKHEIDTGNIIIQKEMPIYHDETFGKLHDRMMMEGADLVVQSVKLIEKGDLELQPQIETLELKHAPKIFKSDCEIKWSSNCEEIYNKIRGLSPFPAAYTTINGEPFKIYFANFEINKQHGLPGEIIIEKHLMKITCNNGFICPTEVQLAGKKRMAVMDYVNGLKGQSSMLAGS